MKLIRPAAFLAFGWSLQAQAVDYSLGLETVATREISAPSLAMAGGRLEAGLKWNTWLTVVSYYDRETFRLIYSGSTTSGSNAAYGLGVTLAPTDYLFVQPFFGRVIRTYGTSIDTDYRYGASLGFNLPLTSGASPLVEFTMALRVSQDLKSGSEYAALCAGIIMVTNSR